MFFDPFGDLGKMFILLPDVVLLAEVNEVDDGFGTEEEEGIYDFDLVYPSISQTLDRGCQVENVGVCR